jgi:hypothetical protein
LSSFALSEVERAEDLLLLLLLLVLFDQPNKIVILSEGTHSTIVSAAVEGPAVAFAVVVAFATATSSSSAPSH